MLKRIFSIAALTAMVAACGGDEAEEGDVIEQDTTVTTGMDTISQPTVVPTTDTVVTTTTVDTIAGEVRDTAVRDTTP